MCSWADARMKRNEVHLEARITRAAPVPLVAAPCVAGAIGGARGRTLRIMLQQGLAHGRVIVRTPFSIVVLLLRLLTPVQPAVPAPMRRKKRLCHMVSKAVVCQAAASK